jgi:hypothetical protein
VPATSNRATIAPPEVADVPLAMPGRTKDAVVVVPREAEWRSGVRQFLRGLGGDPDRITRHLDLLDERAAGRRPWAAELDGRTLPNGRPMPPGRAYAEMLVEEGPLPLYDAGGFTVSVDFHNPDNEAGVDGYEPSLLELAIVADVGAFTAGVPGSSLDRAEPIEVITGQRAERGAALGRLVAALAEAVEARFAYADVGSTGWRVQAASKPTSVVHPSTVSLGPWDFLWSVNVWGPDLVAPGWGDRLDALVLEPELMAKVDRYERPYVRLDRRRLAYGGHFLQYRFLLGTEGRGERAIIDTPLAQQLGLRSTNLQFRQ